MDSKCEDKPKEGFTEIREKYNRRLHALDHTNRLGRPATVDEAMAPYHGLGPVTYLGHIRSKPVRRGYIFDTPVCVYMFDSDSDNEQTAEERAEAIRSHGWISRLSPKKK